MGMNKNEINTIPNRLSGIYMIISPSDKKYIGQSRNIKNRYRSHITPSHWNINSKLTRSFKKYGIEKHTFIILEKCDIKDLSHKEEYYIKLYDSKENGLNLIDKNYTMLDTKKCKNNHKWTDERKKSHSEFLKKWWKENSHFKRNDDWKQKISKARKGTVCAKNEKGQIINVTIDEYNSNPNLVGVTANMAQPKLYKKIKCITDNIVFESIKEAAKYYDFPSSGNIVTSIKNNKPIGMVKHKRQLFFEYL